MIQASRERETCTCLYQRSERERFYCTYLYQLTVGERCVHICTDLLVRERFVHILTPDTRPLVNSYGRGGVVLIYFMLTCSGAERGENGSECREGAKEKEQERERERESEEKERERVREREERE